MCDHQHHRERTVYLPLLSLDKCDTCSVTTNLKLCSRCGERIYCSSTCQQADWPNHKSHCGKTDRIELEQFYPFLAYLAHTVHCHPANLKPEHPALKHTIVNSPNPGSLATELPDGSFAKLVLLGDSLREPSDLLTTKWWPSAMTAEVRRKFLRRIKFEGYALPVAMSICLALLAEMYTTTAVSAADDPDGHTRKRIRLTYKSSPIADFGVVAGSAEVSNTDKLVYLKLSDMSFIRGQDPNDHYWIYFTTVRGETILLDCAMYTFNMCVMVDTKPYRSPHLPSVDWSPAVLRERNLDRHAPEEVTERTRMSVLRNEEMRSAVVQSQCGFHDEDVELVCDFMETLARRPLTEVEIEFTFPWVTRYYNALGKVLETREWATWPAVPELSIEGDPDTVLNNEVKDDDEAWFKYMKKWRTKNKKGQVGKEALVAAFRAWEARTAGASGSMPSSA
ncbi:hypothetical protein DFH06DRAFT_1107534 [Mycena polygramma]|nr:hypothetical protein DFH06DRAFT_1107534 [Mycena polygramma]